MRRDQGGDYSRVTGLGYFGRRTRPLIGLLVSSLRAPNEMSHREASFPC
jgi:hypothetical protein